MCNQIIFCFFLGSSSLLGGCAQDVKNIGVSSMQSMHPVDVILTVEIVNNMLAVKTRFQNVSDQPVLVMEGEWGFGLRENKRDAPMQLHSNEYDIRINGQPVRYKGIDSHIIGSPNRDFFSFVHPREVIDTSYDRLDDSYEFLPGTHEYMIEHIHYQWDEKKQKMTEHRSRPAIFTFTRP
jgi:hypothetical protein